MTDFELATPAGDAVRNKYRNEGAVQERERIIKVLAKEAVWWQDFTALDPNGVVAIAFAQAIAFIKGDNK